MSEFPVNPLVLIGVGSSFAFSGLFYHLYQEKKKELKKLKEIPVFKPDQDLLRVLKASPRRKLQYIAVEGRVEADKETLVSQFVPKCFGVIQKITVEENWKYWNSFNKMWVSHTRNRKETNNAVPFSLISPTAYIAHLHVKVQDPLEASGGFLERVYHNVRKAEEGLVNVLLQDLSGEMPVNMVATEEVLRVGSIITGFGEVVLEGGQVMRLQAPQDGRKYILVPTDHKSFMEQHEKTASMWKILTALTGVTGASVLGCVIYGLVGKRDERSK